MTVLGAAGLALTPPAAGTVGDLQKQEGGQGVFRFQLVLGWL